MGGDGTADFDLNVKIASKRFNCPGETITESDGGVIFTDIGTTGDCLGDGIRTDGKDPSKYTITKNSDSTLTFNSDGYPALKMKKAKSVTLTASTCSLYEIADGSCGQSDLDCAYTKYAKAAEKALQDGTCADQGYTVKTGTQTKSYPVIGDIVISTYSKPALAVSEGGVPGEVFLDGFISGFIGKATHIKKCVAQSEHLVKDAAGLMADLKAHKFNQTIHDIEALVQDVGAEVPSCKGAVEDLEPILEAFKGVHSIKDLVQKLKTNFLAHDREFLDLVEDELQACTFGAPDAHKCGSDLGKQVRSLVIGDQLSSPMVTGHGKIFMEGFIEGFIGKAPEIKACVAQSEKTEKAVEKFMIDIKARKFNKTISDIQTLIGDATEDLSTCKGAVKDLAPILAAFKGIHSIKDLMHKIKENFLAHDKEFLDILDDMIEVCTFGAPDAQKCGEDLGRQSRSLVIGDKLVLV